ncbi:dipeptidyl aminopeptidase/acylaminoacyl peptidase [Knoellia remsis]|uniref:Dipeptidyl aminopeptidase/acylaminoacyl peptidase n=1 Tax=Knoellia remsis TaxID=407159 RepID=A0A2T0UFG1_9MICO|nr:prolyl oligopeptidase family serine peptidase [Knoellia remsis]PRY56673.1 dipeptidyl aminopeptidase/acylaminoacyl peptidase [Knoellia remsis]
MIAQPHGSWPSPLSPAALTAATRALDEVRLDGADTYWLEGRPWEGGRVVLVRHVGATGAVEDVVGSGVNVRSRVHEYGGGAYAVRSGTVVVTTMPDLRVHVVEADGSLRAITPEGGFRYGGLVLGDGFVLAVREDHSGGGDPVNTLVRLSLDGDNADGGRVMWAGSDFVSRPALSEDGTQVAVVTWDHPNMPWDTTTLRRAALVDGDGELDWSVVAGGADVAVGQPRFGPDDSLWFVSDESGWWNLKRDNGSGAESVHSTEADVMQPQWVLGMSDFALLDDGRVLVHWWADGVGRLGILDPSTGALEDLDIGLEGAVQFDQLQSAGGDVAVRVGTLSALPVIVRGLVTGPFTTLRRSSDDGLDPAYAATAQPWTWTNTRGEDVHGVFLAPTHPDVTGPEGELPPLLVFVHGGPTSRSEAGLQLARAFWTTRGFAVLDVNYSGSTGHGRAYRDRLLGQWGVADIDDVVSGARSLAEAGHVDGSRLAIRGGSAGGYTVLRALTTSDAFAAGTSYFGVADLEALATDTHKFESRYLDRLVGPYPEAKDVYVERSPVHHLDAVTGAVLLLQGGIDEVVPQAQAEAMEQALREAGKDVDLVIYPDEGHGFRAASAIEDSLTRELAFYGRVLGFTPA